MSKLDDLASAVENANVARSSEEAKLPQSFHNPNLQDHTQRLKSSADLVLSTASTVLDAGSTEGGGSQYIPTSISELGVPLIDAKRVAIEQWVQDMDTVVEGFGSIRGSSDVGGDPSDLVDQRTASNKGPNSRELDHDLDHLVVKRTFEKAEQHWVEANYSEAEKFFRSGMNRVKRLPTSKQRSFDLNDIQLKVAFARLHQGDLKEAEELFDSLSKSEEILEPSWFRSLESLWKWFGTADEASYKTYAYFGLAQIYLLRDSKADAELMCQRCIDHWRVATSPNVRLPYVKSLQLMALIHEAKKDLATASIISEISIAEGLDPNEKTPYFIDVQRLDTQIDASQRREIEKAEKTHRMEVTARILLALNYGVSRPDFSATSALGKVIAGCAGKRIGSGKGGSVFVPTATEIAIAVETLCDSGANVNAVNVNISRPLITAAERGDLAVVKLLCDRGANLEIADAIGRRALHFAARRGHSAVAKLLLERGARVSPQSPGTGPRRWTPLHLAAFHGHLDIVKILCDAGADLDNEWGECPLICALRSEENIGKVERVVELLCERGANVSATKRDGQSALDLAKLKGGDIEKILMRYAV